MTLGRTQLREKSGKTETYALTHYQPYWKHSGDYSVLRKKTVRRTRIESTVISYPIGFGQIDFRIKKLNYYRVKSNLRSTYDYKV